MNGQNKNINKKDKDKRQKMSSQEAFLNNLLDFSKIPAKKTEQNHLQFESNVMNKESGLYEQLRLKPDLMIQTSVKSTQNELYNSNQKLLKAFNVLREKLTQANRQNVGLQESHQNLQKQLQAYRYKQSFYQTQIQTLTKKLNQLEQQCNQYKLRLNSAKNLLIQSDTKTQQREKNRLNNQKLVEENKRLKQQLKITMELSLHQKIELEQEIQTLKLRQNQLAKNTQEAENLVYKKNNELIQLQNQFKKLKLLYEEQLFLKTANSESLMLKQENQELKFLIEEITTKLKKQKNKKYQLETQLLNLEEKVRLFGTKTDICEGELESALKKIKKVEKQNQTNKKNANSALNQKLSWEEKFLQSTVILQQLISRIKRQLKGDVVELAKTCQFRLRKLKNDEKFDLKEKPIQKRSKSASSKKIRSESKRKVSQLQQPKEQKALMDENQFATFSNTKTVHFQNLSDKKQEFSKTVLKSKPQHNLYNNDENLNDVRKKLFNGLNTNQRMNFNGSSMKCNEKTILPLSQISINLNTNADSSLEAKIRKQREIMEKKLRQKLLYKKIEDSTNQSMKNKLRQEYLNMNFD